ncbi:hypothetical protein LguiB_030533 [Lonicera macranthoides]
MIKNSTLWGGGKKEEALKETWKGGRNLVDVSSFFLFESTGDSEADSNPNPNVDLLIEDVDEGEDAQSFCCGSSWECAGFDNYLQDFSSYDNDKEGDDDEDAIDQEWSSCGKVAMLGQHKKSMVYDDDDDSSTVEEQMNRGEDNDRLFWEACLAS